MALGACCCEDHTPRISEVPIKFGLVDELRIFIRPIILGGGKRWLRGGVHINLELLEMQRFSHGSMYLSYSPVSG